jgi:HAD superfamily phosphoserine phosphatase-like hydrolase
MAVVFFDFDSTVVKKETLDDAISTALAAHPERERIMRDVEDITRLGMEGKLDFKESVKRRIQVVPLSRRLLEDRGEAMLSEISDGMEELFALLRESGHDAHIVSGGFSEYISPVARLLGVPAHKQHTNRFIYDENGTVIGVDKTALLWTNQGKTPVLRAMREQYPTGRFIMVGDGYNDYKAYESGAADTFIGYGANVVREPVKAKAPHFANSSEELLALLKKELQ